MFTLDGSPELTAHGNEVRVEQPPSQSTKFNALWKDGPGLSPAHPAPLCFDVTVVSGDGVWVGVCDEAHFGPGWATKSLAFGGNTSDGGALVHSSFGPAPTAGSVVAVRAELLRGSAVDGASASSTLSVAFAVDGVGLGEAFRIEGVGADGAGGIGPLFPLVALSGPAVARIERAADRGAAAFARPSAAAPRASVAGGWCAPAAAFLGAPSEAPDVLVSVDLAAGLLAAHVANHMRVGIAASPPHGALSPHVASTRMMAPPELAPLEAAVGALLGSVRGLALAADGALELAHAEPRAEQPLRLRAHEPPAQPAATREEVSWLRDD